MTEQTALQGILSRDRWIVGGCLAVLCGLAWLWLVHMAGTGSAAAGGQAAMSGMPMTMSGPAPPPPGFLADLLAAFVMWFLMMVAMMLPSAAPMILLYARFARGVQAQGGALAPTFIFAGAYLVLWGLFSLAAAAAQVGLIHVGVVRAASLSLGSARLAGGLLIAAGIYQLTPLKRACLDQCRSPLSFVTRLWRPGWGGAIRLGLVHGLYCIGCCWLLMALLFVGGVMSLAWVAVLALVVLIEKVAPIGRRGAQVVGGLAIIVGLAMALGLPIPR
jgi:predicted metal-binding membrane protein